MRAKWIFLLLVPCAICSYGCSSSKLEKYGPVEETVYHVAEAVFGEYGDSIPVTFNADSIIAVLRRQERVSEIALLTRYSLDVTSSNGKYLLIVKDGDEVVLYDLSCTTHIDGPIYRYDAEYLKKTVKCL
jgi:hypothetical protein